MTNEQRELFKRRMAVEEPRCLNEGTGADEAGRPFPFNPFALVHQLPDLQLLPLRSVPSGGKSLHLSLHHGNGFFRALQSFFA